MVRRSFLGRGAARDGRGPPREQGPTVSPARKPAQAAGAEVSVSGVNPGIIRGQDAVRARFARRGSAGGSERQQWHSSDAGTTPASTGRGGPPRATHGAPRPVRPQGRTDAEPQGGRGRPPPAGHPDVQQERVPPARLPPEPQRADAGARGPRQRAREGADARLRRPPLQHRGDPAARPRADPRDELPEHGLPAGRGLRDGADVPLRPRRAGGPVLHVARLQEEGPRPAHPGRQPPAGSPSTGPTAPSRSVASASRRPASSAAGATEARPHRGGRVALAGTERAGSTRAGHTGAAGRAGELPHPGRGRELARRDLPRPARVRHQGGQPPTRATGTSTAR